MFDLIVAKSNNNIIGNSVTNDLCWRLKKDMNFFRVMTKTTDDPEKINAVIMGFKTWKSLPKEFLPGRLNLVINKNVTGKLEKRNDFLYHHSSFDILLDTAYLNEKIEKIYIIGGASLYNQYYRDPRLENAYITNIKTNKNVKIEGDVLFPKIPSTYELIESSKTTEGDYSLEFLHYKHYPQKFHPEYQYLYAIRDIIDNGSDEKDRTGVGTRVQFGKQFRWDLSKSFPLLTTKRMYFKGIVEELLWFLRGETDNKELQNRKVRIWDGNSSAEFLEKRGLPYREGDIGPAYGHQFRHFNAEYKSCDDDYTGQGFDQVAYVLDQIRNNPDSRRIMISLWNPIQMDEMALPPCLYSYQFRVLGGKLNCHVINRSNDMALGHPWNIGTGALITYIFAHMTGLQPGTLVHSVSDAHLYKDHINPIKEQLDREPYPFPILKIKDNGQQDVKDYKFSDFELFGYFAHPSIKMNMAV